MHTTLSRCVEGEMCGQWMYGWTHVNVAVVEELTGQSDTRLVGWSWSWLLLRPLAFAKLWG